MSRHEEPLRPRRLRALAFLERPEVRLFPAVAICVGVLDRAVLVNATRELQWAHPRREVPHAGDGTWKRRVIPLVPERVFHLADVEELANGHGHSFRPKRRAICCASPQSFGRTVSFFIR